jgi:CheY-like chemotaxis protein
VVIVEDNEDALELFASLLAKAGHEVKVAREGESGRDLILADKPDVAFVDVGLPGMNGYEVAEQLVRSRLSHTRLVALTGYGGRDARNRALSAGFDDHLVKPFTRDQLEQVFRSLG